MGRPRTPTNVLILKGAFKKDPQRKRVDPKTNGPIGFAPRHLSAAEKKIWRELIKIMPVGIVTCAERIALEEMCYLIHEMRTELEYMTDGRRSLLRSYLGQFGMTPADRAKINVPPPAPKNPYDGF